MADQSKPNEPEGEDEDYMGDLSMFQPSCPPLSLKIPHKPLMNYHRHSIVLCDDVSSFQDFSECRPTTESYAIENYLSLGAGKSKKWKLTFGGIAFMVGAIAILVVTCATTIIAIRIHKSWKRKLEGSERDQAEAKRGIKTTTCIIAFKNKTGVITADTYGSKYDPETKVTEV
ncbi:hypothetical protein GIB67_040318, partial [Kingdonia uniflora]